MRHHSHTPWGPFKNELKLLMKYQKLETSSKENTLALTCGFVVRYINFRRQLKPLIKLLSKLTKVDLTGDKDTSTVMKDESPDLVYISR